MRCASRPPAECAPAWIGLAWAHIESQAPQCVLPMARLLARFAAFAEFDGLIGGCIVEPLLAMLHSAPLRAIAVAREVVLGRAAVLP
jgi:hypothetical protein